MLLGSNIRHDYFDVETLISEKMLKIMFCLTLYDSLIIKPKYFEIQEFN